MPESYVRESVTREDIDSTENPAFVTPSSLKCICVTPLGELFLIGALV